MSNVNNGKRGSRGDVQLERLLRGTLRSGGAPAPTDACLDAETLAAWADELLPSEARAAAEVHAAGCARCQALLAAMARTEPPAVQSEPWWRRRMLGWLVPLTAAATAAVVWVAVSPGMRRAPAESARLTAPTPAMLAEAPSIDRATPSPDPNERLRKLYQDQFKKTEQKAKTEPSAAAPAEERNARTENAPLAKAREQAANARADADKVGAAAPAPAPAMAAAPPPAAARAQVPASSPTVAPVPPARSGVASMNDARMGQMARRFDAGSLQIASPDSSTQWRVNVAGATGISGTTRAAESFVAPLIVVQHSTDGGATWIDQSTGVSAQLTAGASPSASVCWLVGRGGMVLLSIDGRTWTRRPFPEMTDLVAVRATDAATATVTAADGRVFTTKDGGLTWDRALLQESSTAPF